VCVPGKIRVQIETQQFSRINSFNMASSGVDEWEVGCYRDDEDVELDVDDDDDDVSDDALWVGWIHW